MTKTWPTERGPDTAAVDAGVSVEGGVGADEFDDEHPATASAIVHTTTARGFPTGEACPRTSAGRNAILERRVHRG